MKLRGYLIVIICSLGLAFTSISNKRYLLISLGIRGRFALIVGQGVLLLVYPLLGHLADVYLTRYRALKSSLIILTIVTLAAAVYLCPGSSHYPGTVHWSVVCHLQHQVPSSRHSRQCHH